MKIIKSNSYVDKIALFLLKCKQCGKTLDSSGNCEDCGEKDKPEDTSTPTPSKTSRPIEYDKPY